MYCLIMNPRIFARWLCTALLYPVIRLLVYCIVDNGITPFARRRVVAVVPPVRRDQQAPRPRLAGAPNLLRAGVLLVQFCDWRRLQTRILQASCLLSSFFPLLHDATADEHEHALLASFLRASFSYSPPSRSSHTRQFSFQVLVDFLLLPTHP